MAQSYGGFRGRDMTQALLKISFRSRYTSDRFGNSVGDSDSDRRKQTEDAGRMSDRLDSIPKFSLKPSLCEDYFFKACDTPE